MKSFSRATPSFATFSAISAALRVESGAKEDLGMVAGGPPLSSEIQRKSRAISSETRRRLVGDLGVFRESIEKFGRNIRPRIVMVSSTVERRIAARHYSDAKAA